MNSTKTLILGDLHHGRKHKVTYGDPAIWDYKSIAILSKLINEHEPERLILAGDVFDTSKPSALAFSELIGVLTPVPEVWIIAGNHDISRIDEDIAFNNLAALSNINVVTANSHAYMDDFVFVGWHATQDRYVEEMTKLLNSFEACTFITHASRLDFGNSNDNVFTDELVGLAAANGHTVISGHEHKSSISKHFVHLGSVVPHTIAELGPRYYWLDGELIEIENDGTVVLTREDPVFIESNKCYYVKSGKEITVEDIKLEAKDISIDIEADFWAKANEAGYTKELLND